jgi:integrase
MHPSLPSHTTCMTQTGWSQPWNAERLKIIQDQAGHEYGSTTAIYTGVSDEYRNRLLHRKLDQRYPGIWEEPK